MNWKAILPAALLVSVLLPTAAFSRNHHYWNNGMQNPYGQQQLINHGSLMGSAQMNGLTPFANNGISPYANPYAANAYANNLNFANGGMLGMNGGMLGMNNGMMGMNGGMCHRHKHRRRGLLNSLMGQSMMGNGYNNYGNMGGMGTFANFGNRGMYGNGYGSPYGSGLGGGLSNLLRRI